MEGEKVDEALIIFTKIFGASQIYQFLFDNNLGGIDTPV